MILFDDKGAHGTAYVDKERISGAIGILTEGVVSRFQECIWASQKRNSPI